jgi:hypothetical protein
MVKEEQQQCFYDWRKQKTFPGCGSILTTLESIFTLQENSRSEHKIDMIEILVPHTLTRHIMRKMFSSEKSISHVFLVKITLSSFIMPMRPYIGSMTVGKNLMLLATYMRTHGINCLRNVNAN